MKPAEQKNANKMQALALRRTRALLKSLEEIQYATGEREIFILARLLSQADAANRGLKWQPPTLPPRA